MGQLEVHATIAKVVTCNNCGLSNDCSSPIPIQGNLVHPKFLVLGEAPGKIEDNEGRPFVGPAGRFLRSSMRRARINPNDGAFLNTVSCYPRQTKTPDAEAVKACRGNLYAQLDLFPTTPLLVLGSIASRAILPSIQISYASGKMAVINNRLCYFLYHPAFILRDRNYTNHWERCLEEFNLLINGDINPMNFQCLYCTKMANGFVCPSCQSKFAKDCIRPKIPQPKAPTLF